MRSRVQLKHFVQGKEGAFLKLPTQQYKYKPTYLLSLAIRSNDSITNKYLICNISTYKSFLLLILLLLPYLLLQFCFFLLTWFQQCFPFLKSYIPNFLKNPLSRTHIFLESVVTVFHFRGGLKEKPKQNSQAANVKDFTKKQ